MALETSLAESPLNEAAESTMMTTNPRYTGAFLDNTFTGHASDVVGKIRYRPLKQRVDGEGRTLERSSSQDDDDFTDSQFVCKPPKVPYKAIGLAIVLFLLGTVLCAIGGLLLSGVYLDPVYNDRTWPVLFLGIIMFLPGFYHVRIAYYAYKRIPGYDYADIPDWD